MFVDVQADVRENEGDLEPVAVEFEAEMRQVKSMAKKACIYSITNTVNQKKYIGSAIDFKRRKSIHLHHLRKGKHHSPALQRAYLKYGESALVFSPVLYCERQELLRYEQGFIDLLEPEYNVCRIAGSSLGVVRSDETRKRVSDALNVRYSDPKAIQVLSDAHKGYSPTEAHRANLSASLKGHPVTEETRRKISDAQIGVPKSDYARQRMVEGNVGRKRRPQSEETKQKISMTRLERYGKQTASC